MKASRSETLSDQHRRDCVLAVAYFNTKSEALVIKRPRALSAVYFNIKKSSCNQEKYV
jgi:hypothetical protein